MPLHLALLAHLQLHLLVKAGEEAGVTRLKPLGGHLHLAPLLGQLLQLLHIALHCQLDPRHQGLPLLHFLRRHLLLLFQLLHLLRGLLPLLLLLRLPRHLLQLLGAQLGDGGLQLRLGLTLLALVTAVGVGQLADPRHLLLARNAVQDAGPGQEEEELDDGDAEADVEAGGDDMEGRGKWEQGPGHDRLVVFPVLAEVAALSAVPHVAEVVGLEAVHLPRHHHVLAGLPGEGVGLPLPVLLPRVVRGDATLEAGEGGRPALVTKDLRLEGHVAPQEQLHLHHLHLPRPLVHHLQPLLLDGSQLGHPVAALPHEVLEVDVQVGGGEDAAQVHLRGDLQGELGAAAAGVGGEVDPEAQTPRSGLGSLNPKHANIFPAMGYPPIIHRSLQKTSTSKPKLRSSRKNSKKNH